jgi:hypothetical protein
MCSDSVGELKWGQTEVGVARVREFRSALAQRGIASYVFADLLQPLLDAVALAAAAPSPSTSSTSPAPAVSAASLLPSKETMNGWAPFLDQVLLLHARVFYAQPASTYSDAVLSMRHARVVAAASATSATSASATASASAATPYPTAQWPGAAWDAAATVQWELSRWDHAMLYTPKQVAPLGATSHGVPFTFTPEYTQP